MIAGLRIDALHMLALLPDDPADRLRRTQAVLAAAEESNSRAARRWRASLLNNLGMAQHEQGDDRSALVSFELARDAREQNGQHREEQIARYMVGWAQRLTGDLDAARTTMVRLRSDLLADGISDRFVARELELIDARETADV